MNPQEFTQARIAEMVAGVAAYYRKERELYIRHSEPLAANLRAAIQPYFSKELLDRLKTITLTRVARIPPPPFYATSTHITDGRIPEFAAIVSIPYFYLIAR